MKKYISKLTNKLPVAGWGYGLFLSLFVLGQLQRVQVTPTIAIYLHDLLIGTWLAVSSIVNRANWQRWFKKIWRGSSLWLMIVIGWVAIGWGGAWLTHGLPITAILYTGRLVVYALFAVNLILNLPLNSQAISRWWLVAGLTIAWLGLIQYLWLPDTRWLQFLGWDDHYFRLISTQFDPGFTGILLVLTWLSLWKLPLSTWTKIGLALFLEAMILLTYSRASYLAFAVGAGSLIYFQLKQRHFNWLLPIMITVFIVTIPVLPRPASEGTQLARTVSIHNRTDNSLSALRSLTSYQLVIGRGWLQSITSTSTTGVVTTAHFPDNLLILLVTGLGLPGLMVSLYWLVKLIIYLSRAYPSLAAALGAVIVHAQFNHTLFQPFIWLWLSQHLANELTTKSAVGGKLKNGK